MSLGRPVLPPDPIDFHTGDTASGSGASDSAGVGREIAWHAGDYAARVGAADQQCPRLAAPAAPRVRRRAAAPTAAGEPRRASSAASTACDPLDRVRQHDRHVVALAHTKFGVGARQPVGRRIEFAAGQRASLAGDRRFVGRQPGQPRELRADRRDWMRSLSSRPGVRRSCGGCRRASSSAARR